MGYVSGFLADWEFRDDFPREATGAGAENRKLTGISGEQEEQCGLQESLASGGSAECWRS